MNSRNKKLVILATIVIVIIALCISVFAFAPKGSAYEIDAVNISAQIETDGTLRVVDQRQISADEDTNAIVWQVRETTDKSNLKIESARLISPNEENSESATVVNFVSSNIDEDVLSSARSNPKDLFHYQGIFALDETKSNFYFFLPSNHGKLSGSTLEVSYSIDDALYIYDDYAEVYWDYFVSDDSSITPSLSTQVAIPVLEGNEPIPGKNVWAWGHGPAGTVDFQNWIWFFKSENSGSSADGRAHILLARSWVSNVSNESAMFAHGARKDYALEEEKEWTDRSMYTQINTLAFGCAFLGVNIVFVIVASIVYLFKMKKYKNLLESDFENETVLYLKQVEFDERSKKLQLGFLFWIFLFVFAGAICVVLGKSWVGCAACLLSCIVCLIFCNWTPFIHSSWRESLLANKQ